MASSEESEKDREKLRAFIDRAKEDLRNNLKSISERYNQFQAPMVASRLPAFTVKGPKRVKKQDLSRYLEAAKLTDRQYECASLRWEFGVSVSQIARDIGLHRTTVDQHIEAARMKMRSAGMYEKVKRGIAKFRPEE